MKLFLMNPLAFNVLHLVESFLHRRQTSVNVQEGTDACISFSCIPYAHAKRQILAGVLPITNNIIINNTYVNTDRVMDFNLYFHFYSCEYYQIRTFSNQLRVFVFDIQLLKQLSISYLFLYLQGSQFIDISSNFRRTYKSRDDAFLQMMFD